MEKIGGVKSASLCWVMPCGAAADPAGCDGASAMWEELLQRGAGERDSRAFADAADRIGMARSVDASTLMMRVSATMLGERIEEAAGLLADMVLRPRFEEEAIEPSRELALSALESLKDDPQQRVSLLASARHLPDPFGRSGLGTEAGLKALKPATLAALHREWVVASNVVLTATGDFDPKTLVPKLKALLKRLPQRAFTVPRRPHPGPAEAGDFVEIQRASRRSSIRRFPVPAYSTRISTSPRWRTSCSAGMSFAGCLSGVREEKGLAYFVAVGAGERTACRHVLLLRGAPLRARTARCSPRSRPRSPGWRKDRSSRRNCGVARRG